MKLNSFSLVMLLFVVTISTCNRSPQSRNANALAASNSNLTTKTDNSGQGSSTGFSISEVEEAHTGGTKGREAYAPTMTTSSAAEAQGVGERIVEWNDEGLFRGDCMVDKGFRIVFKVDGTGYLEGRVRSSDTNDAWKMFFHVKDKANNVVFTLPPQSVGQWTYFIQMREEHTWYPFRINFKFPADKYYSINTVTPFTKDCD